MLQIQDDSLLKNLMASVKAVEEEKRDHSPDMVAGDSISCNVSKIVPRTITKRCCVSSYMTRWVRRRHVALGVRRNGWQLFSLSPADSISGASQGVPKLAKRDEAASPRLQRDNELLNGFLMSSCSTCTAAGGQTPSAGGA